MKRLYGTPRKDLTWQRVPVGELDLTSRHFVVVGGTGGIGRAIAQTLVARGADVTVCGRTFRDEGVEHLSFIAADLTLMTSAEALAAALPVENIDTVIFTNGILSGKNRVATEEGIEIDLAVSYLSRFVMLRNFGSRLRTRPDDASPMRVFVMGFPGSKEKGDIDDFNSETKYSSMTAHLNTIMGNEALVLDAPKRYPHLRVYGLNPGLVKTTIRESMLGSGFFSRITESIIGALFLTAPQYAERIVPLLVSKDLDGHSGAVFNQRCQAIEPNRWLTQERISQIMAASKALVERAFPTPQTTGSNAPLTSATQKP